MYVETRPPVSTAADFAQWEAESKLRGDPTRKFGDNNVHKDSRLTQIIIWVLGVASIVTAAAAIAMVTRFFQMGDSQVRMEGKIDASNQVQTLQFNQIDRRFGALENRVGAIEQRQVDAQNMRAGP